MNTTTSEIVARPIRSQADLQAIDEARTRAGVPPAFAPTHVIEVDGKTVGYGSLNAIPMLTGWVDDSIDQATALEALRQMEEDARRQGLPLIMIACFNACRFGPDLERMGYTKNMQARHWHKLLRKDSNG